MVTAQTQRHIHQYSSAAFNEVWAEPEHAAAWPGHLREQSAVSG